MDKRIIALVGIVAGLLSQNSFASYGRTPGEYDVSSMGSAQYTIPIWAPPGIRGVQPVLALTYDSRLSYGLMGPGWTLSGLSAIARCNKTFAQDGAPAPIILTTADGLCLDGNRLRTTGTGVYQTEIANFSQVTASGTAGNGPSYFTVQGKDGLTYEYGNTTDSKILPPGSTTPYIWALDKVTDRSGNTMTFTYYQASGSYVPLSIQYTAPSGSTTFPYKIDFNYSTKSASDTINKFVAGSQIQQTQQLSTITVTYSGTTLREYKLSYTTSSATLRATLTSIQECGGSTGADCLPATSVGYQYGTAGVASPATASGSGATNGTVYSIDIDGDGKQDLVFATSTGSTYTWWVQFATSSGYSAPVNTGASSPPAITKSGNILQTDFLIDSFDGTAGSQILSAVGNVWYEYKWNGSSFTATSTGVSVVPNAQYSSADVDGDGLPDLAYINTSTSSQPIAVQINTTKAGGTVAFASPVTIATYLSGWPTTTGILGNNQLVNSTVKKADFDGDGRQDLLYFSYVGGRSPHDTFVELLSRGTSAPVVSASTIFFGGSVALANWNDDACTDLITGNELLINQCNGGISQYITLPGYPSIALDWDGDGRTDALANVSGTWQVIRSEGSTFAPMVSTGIVVVGTGMYAVTDQNGDGLDDLAYPNSTAGNAIYYGLHNGASIHPDLATAFTDGYGNFAKPSYVTLTSGSDYGEWFTATYPNRSYIGPLYVVNESVFNDAGNSGSTWYQQYWYGEAEVNLQGRGFIGFGAMQTYDSRTTLWETKDYDLAFPFYGMVTGDYLAQVYNNTYPVQVSTGTPQAITLSSATYEERYFPNFPSTTQQVYELGGSKNGNLITTVVTDTGYDSYGNAISITSTVTDNDPTSPFVNDTWTTTIANTITANASTWCLMLPTETTVTKSSSAPNGAAITRTVQYNNPDYTNCRETEKVTEPGSAAYKVTEDYGYDGFGNLHTDTVTGVGMTPRVTTVTWNSTGQFPQTIQNPLSQSITLGFDAKTGLKTSQTDPNYTASNPLTTTWGYDDFARETSEVRPDGTSTTVAYSACGSSCVNANNKMTVTETLFNVGGSTQRIQNTYLDWFDRPLVTSTTMLNGAFDRNEVQYDNRGNVLKRDAPCTFDACVNYWTTYGYDALDRITESQRPISATNGTLQTTSIAYAGRTTTVTDALNHATTKISLVTGGLARSQDATGYYQNFSYDAFGSLLSVVDNSPSNTLFTASYQYGLKAFQVASTDTDLGPRSYTYDALGELIRYSDAKGQVFSSAYDALSRPTSRTEPDLTTTWTWGNTAASFNIGKIQSVTAASAAGTYAEAYGYDSKTRLSIKQLTIPGDASYTYTSTYNATTGLLDTLQYPVSTAGYQLKLQYTYQNGILQQVSDAAAGTHYWTADTMNPRGQLTQETLGNGVVVNRALDAVTGWVSSIQAGVGSGSALQNNSYLFDEMGNLSQRQDNNLGLTENAYPDSLYRLNHTVGDSNTQLSYDALGRIATWTAYGKPTVTNNFTTAQPGCTYYANPQLHAVRSSTATGQPAQSFCYDANGNTTTISSSGITMGAVDWTSFNQPNFIASGTTSGYLYYDGNHQRYKQAASYAGSPETTIYVGGLLEKVSNSSGTTYRHYIPGGNNLILYSRASTGVNAAYYITKDHLGSSAVITDQTGALIVKERFGAQGLNENTPTEQATIARITRHEFTGQEQIDNTGVLLTNMNGRIYSPVGGIFFLHSALREPHFPAIIPGGFFAATRRCA